MLYSGFKLIQQRDGCLRLVDMNIAATDNMLELVNEMVAYSKNPSLLLEKKQEFELNALITKVTSLLVVPENIRIVP